LDVPDTSGTKRTVRGWMKYKEQPGSSPPIQLVTTAHETPGIDPGIFLHADAALAGIASHLLELSTSRFRELLWNSQMPV
jgi:hypothetical protein